MNPDPAPHSRAVLYRVLFVAALLLGVGLWFVLNRDQAVDGARPRGNLELEQQSDYSKIRIRKQKNVRTLIFVRDSGEEITESQVDLDQPHDLLVEYTKFMFLSYAFRSKQEKVLMVGLGGGSMIHFLKHHDPGVKMDVVEIDPAIVKIADKYFNIRADKDLKIINQDAFEYFKKAEGKYDVVYMDAFLKPAPDTDSTGVPLRLKTINFYKEIQKSLKENGLVVYNINPHEKEEEDLKNIREAFPQAYVFRIPNDYGFVAVGSMSSERLRPEAIRAAGQELDRRFKTRYSFRDMAGTLDK